MVATFLKATASNKHIDFSNVNFKNYRFDKDFGTHILAARKHVYFNSCGFENCEFVSVRFVAGVSFINECIFEDTEFTGVTFKGENANFTETSFKATHSPFQRCFFDVKKVSFVGSLFALRNVPFHETFMKADKIVLTNVDIESNRFRVRSTNEGSVFDSRYLSVCAKDIDFTGLKFDGHFEYTNIPELNRDCVEPPMIDFTGINFTQMKSATFLKANLKRARFASAVLTNVNFITPIWPRKDVRRSIFDELDPVDGAEIDEHRRVYAQLKKNYEDNRDFVRAGQWYYRETECRRRMVIENCGKWWFMTPSALFVRFIFWIYRCGSEYGENYARPFYLLSGVWLSFAVIYFFNGFKLGGKLINYELVWAPEKFLSSGIDFFRALAYSAAAMATPLVKTFEFSATWVVPVHTLQVLLTVILLSLFLFALRRKFKV